MSLSPARVLLAAGAVALLVGCGATEPSEAGEPEAEETIRAMVRLVTDSGHVAANHDDEWCVWGATSYTLRNESGEVIATGEAASVIPGEGQVAGEDGLLGEVEGTDPYECALKFTVADVPIAEFYEVEVSASAPRSDEVFEATASFEEDEVESGYVDIEVAG